MDFKKTDVQNLLKDGKFIDELVKGIVSNPEVVEEMAEDIAEEIAEYLEDDPSLKKKIIESVMAAPEFRERIITEIVKELDD